MRLPKNLPRTAHPISFLLALLSLPIWLGLAGNVRNIPSAQNLALYEPASGPADWLGPLVLVLILGLCVAVYSVVRMIILLGGALLGASARHR
jgi:hypothetical protein